jgi:hypothetical protein
MNTKDIIKSIREPEDFYHEGDTVLNATDFLLRELYGEDFDGNKVE